VPDSAARWSCQSGYINGDEDPVNRFALCVLACDGVAVGKVAEIPPQGTAIGEGDLSVDRYRFDRDQFAVDQGFFAVGGFAVAPDEKFFADGNGEGFFRKEGDFFCDGFGVNQVNVAVWPFDDDKAVLDTADMKRLARVEKFVFAVENHDPARFILAGFRKAGGDSLHIRG